MYAIGILSGANYIIAGVPHRTYNGQYGWCTGMEMWYNTNNTYFLLRLGTKDCLGQKFYIYYI